MPEGPSSDAVAKVLRHHGFELVHQRGSHAKFRSSADPVRVVIVPMSRGHLKIGTFRSICRQAGLRPSDF
ncbi:type II toxin-antitoxin system HicA family toxin [Kineosporia sp. NBRC 101677]|uniref:type II toxin-antitoxin system HicA family toxin n=1 Tax=Kineosporia sp. NBRC 101677 TaxID=3032197 RepID=UPI00331958A8